MTCKKCMCVKNNNKKVNVYEKNINEKVIKKCVPKKNVCSYASIHIFLRYMIFFVLFSTCFHQISSHHDRTQVYTMRGM